MSKRKLVLANNPLLSGPALNEREKLGIPYRVININAIDADPNQPRTNFDQEKLNELADSIKTYGILSPILVKPGNFPGRYTLISGERRLRASKMVGLTEVPVLVDQTEENQNDRTLAIQLVENLQRSDLSSLERAHAIGALRDSFQLSVRDIAAKLGISKSMVQRSLEILDLPDDLLNALKNGAAESKVLLLSKIDDPKIRASYLNDLETLTRSELEKGLNREPKNANQNRVELSPEDKRLVDELRGSLGMKVNILRTSDRPEAGKLAIDFYSDTDLQEIFRRLVNE